MKTENFPVGDHIVFRLEDPQVIGGLLDLSKYPLPEEIDVPVYYSPFYDEKDSRIKVKEVSPPETVTYGRWILSLYENRPLLEEKWGELETCINLANIMVTTLLLVPRSVVEPLRKYNEYQYRLSLMYWGKMVVEDRIWLEKMEEVLDLVGLLPELHPEFSSGVMEGRVNEN